MKSRLLWFCLLVFPCCLSVALFAQDTASITGTVTDPSGAAVANAQVGLTSTEHGITRTTTTNGSGDYLFASLPIGSYDLAVSETGFRKYQAKGVILRVAEKTRVNVVLQIGAINTEVVVQGTEVAQVETQSSDLGGTVTGKEITQLAAEWPQLHPARDSGARRKQPNRTGRSASGCEWQRFVQHQRRPHGI